MSDETTGGPINHPAYYQGRGGMEVIDVIDAFGLDGSFTLGNAAKYLLRAGKKGDAVEDLEKAIWYLRREVERLKTLKNKGFSGDKQDDS